LSGASAAEILEYCSPAAEVERFKVLGGPSFGVARRVIRARSGIRRRALVRVASPRAATVAIRDRAFDSLEVLLAFSNA